MIKVNSFWDWRIRYGGVEKGHVECDIPGVRWVTGRMVLPSTMQRRSGIGEVSRREW